MELKICTFNVRIDTQVDGENSFSHRLPLIVKTIEKERPDFIGFQELSSPMRKSLASELKDYVFIGGGREANRAGESAAIAYLRDNFILCDCETKWLSNTPLVPGSSYGLDQSHCPRVFTSAVFTSIEGGKAFRIINVHTDHKGVKARLLASAALLAHISEKKAEDKAPVFITGDFNAHPDSDEMILMKSYDGLLEATENIGKTFHDYGRNADYAQIDYIFHTAEFKKTAIKKLEVVENGLYISDHWPILATFTDEE